MDPHKLIEDALKTPAESSESDAVQDTLYDTGKKVESTIDKASDQTIDVINPYDKSIIKVPLTKLNGAIKAGGIIAPKFKQSDIDPDDPNNILLINPYDKSTIAVPKEKVHDALLAGGTLFSDKEHQTKVDEKVADYEKSHLEAGRVAESVVGGIPVIGTAAKVFRGLGEKVGEVITKPDLDKMIDKMDYNDPVKLEQGMKELFTASSKDVSTAKIYGKDIDGKKTLALSVNGQPIDIPFNDWKELTPEEKHNYKFRDPLAQEEFDAQIEIQKNHPIGRSISTFLENATRPGFLETIEDKINNSKLFTNSSRIQFLAGIANSQEEHPIAGTAGDVVGTLGGIAIPTGGIAQGVEGIGKLLPGIGKAVPWLAGKAIEGAVISAPQAANDLIKGNLPKAGEDLAWGMGLNSLFGIVGKGASKLIEKVGEATEKAAPKTTILENAFKDFGISTEKLGSTEQQSSFLSHIEGKSPEEAKNILLNIAKGGGKDLEESIIKLNNKSEGLPVTDLMSKINEIGQKVEGSEQSIQGIFKIINKEVDDNGKIPLRKLLEIVQETGSTKTKDAVMDIVNKETHAVLLNELVNSGNKAIEGQDVKLTKQWIDATYNLEKANQIVPQLIQPVTDKSVKENHILDWLLHKGVEKAFHVGAGTIGFAHLGPIGAMASYEGSKYATKKILNAMKSNPENPSLLANTIQKLQEHPDLASYSIIDLIHASAATAEKVTPFLENLGSKSATLFHNSGNPIKTILGDNSNGLSTTQQFNKLADNVSNLVGNPDVRESHLKELTSPWEVSHPLLAAQMKQDFNNKIQYISQIMPKDPGSFKPFQKSEKWEVSKADLDNFNEQLKIAQNPYALLDNLKNGSITVKQVATAAMLNPEILKVIQSKVAENANNPKVNLTYQQRLSASIIMGQAMDDSLRKINQLQSSYQQNAPAQQEMPKHKKENPKSNLSKLPAAQSTMAQRIGK